MLVFIWALVTYLVTLRLLPEVRIFEAYLTDVVSDARI